MKAKFELRTWLSSKRDYVIAEHTRLTQHPLYSGITLKEFMLEHLGDLEYNNVKSESRAEKMMPMFVGKIFLDNSKVHGEDKVTKALEAKYAGTAYMAMV